MKLRPEEFITIWQQAASMDDFVNKTGIPRRRATNRAISYRRKGVPLQKLYHGRPGGGPGRHKLDYDRLAELARSFRQEGL